MKKVILLINFVLILSSPSFGFHKTLNDSLVQEAIDYGKKHKKTEMLEFWKPWAALPEGQRKPYTAQSLLEDVCFIITKWNRIADLSRDAAQKYQTIDASEVREIKRDDRLFFMFTVRGNRSDFAKDIHSVIKIDTLIIQPFAKHNPDVAQGVLSRYSATCVHIYDEKDLPENATIEFIIIRKDAPKFVPKETIYKIDLSKIK